MPNKTRGRIHVSTGNTDLDRAFGQVYDDINDVNNKIVQPKTVEKSKNTDRVKGVEINDTKKSDGKTLVYNSKTNKLDYKTISGGGGAGDLTAVVAGTGLTGTDLSGPIPTLNIDSTVTTLAGSQTLTNKTLTTAVLGSSTATTQSDDDNSTKVATTAYVDSMVGGVSGNATHTGDVTGATTLTIANDTVTYAKMQNISSSTGNRILGRTLEVAGTHDIEEMTPAEVKTMMSLNNVDNTSDANKPVSTATQTALDLKLNLAGDTMTGQLILDGNPTLASGDGTKLHIDGSTPTVSDATGTVARYSTVSIEKDTISATNGSVVITDSASLYIADAPRSAVGGTFPTLTNRYALWVDAGEVRFDGALVTNSTVDGVDIATRDDVLTSTTTTANAALPKAGGTMTGDLTMGSLVVKNDIVNVELINVEKFSIGASSEMTAIYDEDSMGHDSPTGLVSQQSVKAYVDNNSHIKVATVTLDEADMNDLHNTAIVIVPAQGANTVIIPTSGMLFIDRDNSTAQANSYCDLFVSWNGAKYPGRTIYYIRRFMVTENDDRIWNLGGTMEASRTLTDGNNQPLTIAVDSAVTSGSIDSMKVAISYYVFDNS